MRLAWWDTETDGLLQELTKMHSIGIIFNDGGSLSCADQPGYLSLVEGVQALQEADIRVAHNGDDFDERAIRKLYPAWTPKEGSETLDTLLISRLLYPVIYSQGPNSHKCPPQLRSRHSLEAWGYRLGLNKIDYSHVKSERIKAEHPDWTKEQVTKEVWREWDPEMQSYMMDGDVPLLVRLFKWLMAQKPSMEAVRTEHDFARIIRRQEAWGFTFDEASALTLQAEVSETVNNLEAELIEGFGNFWMAGKLRTNTGTRSVALPKDLFPYEVTEKRISPKTGKELKPYVGPPKCTYEDGAKWTPVSYVQFQPSSPLHVERMFKQKYGWKPKAFTDKGAVKLDDEVLRQLSYPEAGKLADLYSLLKILGYVSKGTNAWIKMAKLEEDGQWRMHGRVLTIGTYTFRCSHSRPNTAQVPSRDPVFGHRCRALFTAREGFKLVGFDGSGMQLRLMAHHMAKYDGGRYAQVFIDGQDPHIFMADSIGRDIMGGEPGGHDEGRMKGKTIDYALPFGGGEARLGSIIEPYAADPRKKELGKLVKERMGPTFGEGFEALKLALRHQVEKKGYLIGLDGRKVYTNKAHFALSSLLQMGEAIIMRNALIILDDALKAEGFRCGVDEAGNCRDPREVDYEFVANVHDEAQADVKPEKIERYRELALWCVAEAGRKFKLSCPLSSDVKVGDNWQQTH